MCPYVFDRINDGNSKNWYNMMSLLKLLDQLNNVEERFNALNKKTHNCIFSL